MNTNELTWMQDHRQIIHDLVIQKRATGLSPPEEEILEWLEASELHDARSNEFAPGLFVSKKERTRMKIHNNRMRDLSECLKGGNCYDRNLIEWKHNIIASMQ